MVIKTASFILCEYHSEPTTPSDQQVPITATVRLLPETDATVFTGPSGSGY